MTPDDAAPDGEPFETPPAQPESSPLPAALGTEAPALPEMLEFLGEEPPEFVAGGAPSSPAQALEVLANLLLTTNHPLTQQRLQNLLGGVAAESLKALLDVLSQRVEALGLQLDLVAGGYQLASKPAYAEWVWKLTRPKQRMGLTPQSLETLGIVAYKQPVTKSEIDVIRGMDSGNLLRNLVDIEMVEIRGRKEVPGRPLIYGTTQHFLKTFGLNKVEELPSVQELKRIYSERERERLEAEARAAQERRVREHEEALTNMARYKPPVTELGRALSEEEKRRARDTSPMHAELDEDLIDDEEEKKAMNEFDDEDDELEDDFDEDDDLEDDEDDDEEDDEEDDEDDDLEEEDWDDEDDEDDEEYEEDEDEDR